MPTSDDRADVLVDTSVAIALVVSDHEHHADVVKLVGRRHLGLAGHAAFETFSVLTRLPPPLRLTPVAAGEVIQTNFPHTCFLEAAASRALLRDFGREGIGGGRVYDALVGAAARAHGLPLVTRDRRARDVYAAVGAEVQLLS